LNDTKKGIFLLLLSVLLFAFMDVCIRMAGDIPSLQKSFFRNLVSFCTALFLLYRSKEPVRLQKKNIPYLFLRSAVGTMAVLFSFYSIDHMILSDATILNKLSPFFNILFSYLILKEKPSGFQWACILTAFFGCLFILRPTASSMVSLGALAALASGIFAGFSYCMVRCLNVQGVKGPVIVLCFSAFSCLSTLPVLLFHYTPMSLAQSFWLLMVGLFAAGGQFSMTLAFRYAPASRISVYDYTALPAAAILGYLFFGQIPEKNSFIGYAIILTAAILMYLEGSGRFKRKVLTKQ